MLERKRREKFKVKTSSFSSLVISQCEKKCSYFEIGKVNKSPSVKVFGAPSIYSQYLWVNPGTAQC